MPDDRVMNKLLAILVAAVVLLTGCADGRTRSDEFPVGTSSHEISVGGLSRNYLVTVPVGLRARSPLVVMMHGGFGSASQARESYGWDELAVTENLVVAYPDGLGRAWNAGGGCCGKSGEDEVDDVAFIEAMVGEIRAGLRIDDRRIYATGMSNGAMMSYRLACDTDTFAAIAPVAGTILGACEHPAPISVIAIHGEADDSVHMDGSAGNGAERIDGMPVLEVSALWREVDGCDAPTVTVEAAVTTSTTVCRDRRGVQLVTIAGAGHQWPGSARTAAQQRIGADEPYPDLDATAVIWAFFEAHP